MSLTGGIGTLSGGAVQAAGASTAVSGGSVAVFSGEGEATSSGDVFLRTANAGTAGREYAGVQLGDVELPARAAMC